MMAAPTVTATEQRYPAPGRRAFGTVNGVETEVTSITFSDKIMITLSQEGRLSHWIQVPIQPSPTSILMAPLPSRSALPAASLTPTTLLGGGTGDRDTIGHVYAAQIANYLSLRNPESSCTLVLGLGIRDMDGGREGFADVLELVQKVL